MLATGSSMELGYKALLSKGMPAKIHVASVIASRQSVEYVKSHFPADRTTLWIGAIDDEINAHSYIVPGLGDAGDLAFGEKDDK
jgi:uracil phosphoribosyltransferase